MTVEVPLAPRVDELPPMAVLLTVWLLTLPATPATRWPAVMLASTEPIW